MATQRRRLLAIAVVVVSAVAATITGSATAGASDSRESVLRVELTGLKETPLALSTSGNGSFRAFINDRTQQITYRLSYDALEAPVTQAHIHLGQSAQTGGIIVFLCSNLPNPPAGTQACPAPPATITGTLTAAHVIGPAAQGIAAAEFAELIAAIRGGSTYVNVHSEKYPGGEIRGQLDHEH